MMKAINLDGRSLTRAQLVEISQGAPVTLDARALTAVAKAATFLSQQVSAEEPIYGVSTGFGSNADRLLGAHRLRERSADESLHEELQRNLIISHAVCVGEPFAADVVRAMLAIRINTLLMGHSGIRVESLEALAAMLNAGIVPVVPKLGSVGASGDLAPLSHLAMVLLGEGEAFYKGERLSGAQALERAGLKPLKLSYKEGLALNNGTAQMLATGVLAIHRLESILENANIAAAMTIEAFAGRLRAFDEKVHAIRPHPGQVNVASEIRALLHGSTFADIYYHLVPRFYPWLRDSWLSEELKALRFDIGWDWVPVDQRHGREKFYQRYRPFKGGKKHQPQDSYSLRCIPQVHGAVWDAIEQAKRVLDVELNSVTDNPLIFSDDESERIEDRVVSAGHFHGMPLALVMSYVKASIPVLASISERRLNKLVDPATSDGLPPFLIGNEDATDSGFMIVQYTAAAIVNDLCSRAHPASVYSIPTSANAEDHVSMGANEARHVLDMSDDLAKVIGLEIYTAAQALDFRSDMINAARKLSAGGKPSDLEAKIRNSPRADDPRFTAFQLEVNGLFEELSAVADFKPSPAIAAAHAAVRKRIAFMDRDRALNNEVMQAVDLVQSGEVLQAVRGALAR